jgi:uncharacterized protein DUF4190
MSRPQPVTQSSPAGAPAVRQRTSRMAIWSLVLAILTIGGLGSIVGILMGMAARRRVAVTGERGAGLAVAGIVIGVITLLLAIAYWVYLGSHVTVTHGGGGGGGPGGY